MKNLFLILFSFFLFACSNSQSASDNPTETVTEAGTSTKNLPKKLAVSAFIQQYEASSGGILLDVRTPEEVAAGTIPNAKTMNFYDDSFQSSLQELDKTKPIFVYCKSGGRSGQACDMLQKMGFGEIYDLEGGYTAWSATNGQ